MKLFNPFARAFNPKGWDNSFLANTSKCLFVPISIGLVEHIETLLQALPAMLLTCALATLILLVVVGKAYQHWEHKHELKATRPQSIDGEAK